MEQKRCTPRRPNDLSHDRANACGSRRLTWAVCGGLLVAVAAVFGQAVHHGFVNYDDPDYVYENRHVLNGLRSDEIAWAFTTCHSTNWHPLTWLSHQLDYSLYGSWAGGHHLTNVLLHAATAILLFLTLQKLTGVFWPSAFAAFLFAIHPLRVESVAWVAERKDVLSGLLCMATLWAYAGYARHSGSWWRYLAVAAFFALGLMAKPVLVTLPCVLLLLDYWPLGRFRTFSIAASPTTKNTASSQNGTHGPNECAAKSAGFLLLEKIPLFAMTVASCMATFFAQSTAVVPLERLPFRSRVANAIVSYTAYLGDFFFPSGLAPLYPHPKQELEAWKIAAAALLLAAVTTTAWKYRRRFPYLLVGWLWYLGTLVPMIGLVQVGVQAKADRYTYLPQIGLAMALAWGATDFCSARSISRSARWIAALSILLFLTFSAARQTAFWHDSESLWNRTLDCTSHNLTAHINLSEVLALSGRYEEAARQLEAALSINSKHVDAYNNLGRIYAHQSRISEAMQCYREAIRINPKSVKPHSNLGKLLIASNQLDEGIAECRLALELQPEYAEAHQNLGNGFLRQKRTQDAMREYRTAVALKPDFVDAHYNLACLLATENRPESLDEAIEHYAEALRLRPDDIEARCNLAETLARRGRAQEAIVHYRQAIDAGVALPPEIFCKLAWLLASCPDPSVRNGVGAVEFAQRANQLAGVERADLLDALAAAYAEAGRFPEAVATARRAAELAEKQNRPEMAKIIRARLVLYEAGKPFRQ